VRVEWASPGEPIFEERTMPKGTQKPKTQNKPKLTVKEKKKKKKEKAAAR
jgi:hypothetical protein